MNIEVFFFFFGKFLHESLGKSGRMALKGGLGQFVFSGRL
jgi:hypothetical protein